MRSVHQLVRTAGLVLVLMPLPWAAAPATGREQGASSPGRWHTLAGTERNARATERVLRRLMSRRGVAALSVAVVDGRAIAFATTLGVVDPGTGAPAGVRTVFRAASLSKPVFAYLVMRLVDEGVMDLDTPIHRYLEKPLYSYPSYASFRDDSRYKRLTARLLLSHQGGLPNWRRVRPDGPIQFHSDPGDHFGYSGEGYRLLQFTVEQLTHRDVQTLAREKVFGPLAMNDSSFLWEQRFDDRFAVDLGSGLGRLIRETRHTANAAGSLVTNAADYGRFLAAVMNGVGLSARTRAAMLEPQVALTSRSLFSPPGTDAGANRAHKMTWTPGWGRFEDAYGTALFHVGLEEGCENYALVFPGRRLGIASLSLTTNLGSFSESLVDYAIGADFSPLAWLEYGESRPDDRLRALLLAAVAAFAVLAAGGLVLVLRIAGVTS